ncbi:Uncharacterised protein [uncultured archaeon]|nr:Uncharacterised protein [uncultured archaeon]
MGSVVASKIFPHDARFTRVISILSVLNLNSGKLGLRHCRKMQGPLSKFLIRS